MMIITPRARRLTALSIATSMRSSLSTSVFCKSEVKVEECNSNGHVVEILLAWGVYGTFDRTGAVLPHVVHVRGASERRLKISVRHNHAFRASAGLAILSAEGERVAE